MLGDPKDPAVARCLVERWDTIAADPRWPPIMAQLLAHGFTLSSPAEKFSSAMVRPAPLDQQSRHARNRNAFNAVMAARAAAYWNAATFKPVRHMAMPVRSRLFTAFACRLFCCLCRA